MLNEDYNNICNLTHKSNNKLTPNPISSNPPENFYDILQYDDDDDDKTIATSNKSCKHECDSATAVTADLTEDDLSSDDDSTPTEFAILDSGATAHFLIKGAAVKNKLPATNPLRIKLPNGSLIKSTHTCNLDIPWLPNNITEAHVVPGLSHSSLVSTRKFCDAGCKITFDIDECRIVYKGKLVLAGTRDPTSGHRTPRASISQLICTRCLSSNNN